MAKIAVMRDAQGKSINHLEQLLFPSHARIVIIGLGLMGMSLLHAARRAWPGIAIDSYDSDCDARAYGRAAGASITVHEKIWLIPSADIYLICTPASSVVETFESISASIMPGAIVMDIASVKGRIMAKIGPLLPRGVHYLSAHPMAGGSTSGAEFACADLFQGRPCPITPLGAVPADKVKAAELFWSVIGSVPGSVVSPARHDDRVALTSHLPHLVAFALMDALESQSLGSDDRLFIGRSLLDLIRLGTANPAIWRDIFSMNREHILRHLDAFDAALSRWRKILACGSDADIAAALHNSVSIATRSVPHDEPSHG